MSTHKNIDRICVVILVVTLILSLIFCNGNLFGIQEIAHAAGYENRLFDDSVVHTIDIVMDDWDGFIETCENEEYAICSVVIDGESYKNVGIRGKGNTSLSSVSSMGSSRYSFKIEFDHYDSTNSYYGLDKLSLNNIIQDNTYMKDYLAYTLMNSFGVDTPLCSYAYMTVNGEDWGLYLAVEGVEDAFLQRNYGNDYGELYKPDSMSFGGGRGNGMDFDMNDFNSNNENRPDENGQPFSMPDSFNVPEDAEEWIMPDDIEIPDDFDPSEMTGDSFDFDNMGETFGGMGSSDVKLQYIDDDPDSYENIFNNAKTDVSTADQNRLIQSLKNLSEGDDIESTVNVEEVIRYFVVHNFLCNDDSYTGTMVHNYYLYEEDGQLSMIPWDYNLAFGTFQSSDATSVINSPIDTPVSGDMSDRPMISWIFDSEEYTELYHVLFSEFISETNFTALIDETVELISEYVEKDPTKFCTYEEFEKGVSAIRDFCLLRAESVQGQIDGVIPSTSDGQNADDSTRIDASELNLSDMGTMNNNGGFGGFERKKDENQTSEYISNTSNNEFQTLSGFNNQNPDDFDGEIPEGFDPSEMSGGEMPDGFDENAANDFTFPDNQGSDTGNSEFSGESAPFSDFSSNGNNDLQQNNSEILLLCISVLVLIGGLIVAIKFKR